MSATKGDVKDNKKQTIRIVFLSGLVVVTICVMVCVTDVWTEKTIRHRRQINPDEGANCTFERESTCGYKIRDGVNGWRLTYKKDEGKSVLQHGFRPSTSQIVSPPLNTSLPSCVILKIERYVEEYSGIIGSGTSLAFEKIEDSTNHSTIFWNLPVRLQFVIQQNISANVALFTLTTDVREYEQYRLYSIQLVPGSCPPLVCNKSGTPCDDMSMCIPRDHVCNGLSECPDESDENNCTSFTSVNCSFRHQYHCGYGKDSAYVKHWQGFKYFKLPGISRFGLQSRVIDGFLGPLSSPIFSVDVPSCYLFDFILDYWTERPNLNVSVLDMSSNETHIVWAQKNRRGNSWRLGQFDMFPGRYQVYFNTDNIFKDTRYVLSNTRLRPGPCLEDVFSCSLDEFTCMDGQCISEKYACDYSPNCNDESDLTSDNQPAVNFTDHVYPRSLRLTNESDFGETVEVKFNNTWELICLPVFYLYTSHKPICNILGYSQTEAYVNRTKLTSVWYNGCDLQESDVESCFVEKDWCRSSWFLSCWDPICIHAEKVGNSRALSPRDRIRLQGGVSKNEGRVEVFFNNTWGTVCNRGWTARESTAVCRTLGFGGESRMVENTNLGTGRIWLDDVKCIDTEKFFNCQHSRPGFHLCNHYLDVVVRCDPGCFSDQVVCEDRKTCIESNSLCDGENDCPDGDDERKCPSICQLNQFVCDRYRTCLSMPSKCDGIIDCLDGTDELNCVRLSDSGVAMLLMDDGLYPVCKKEHTGEQLSNMLCQSMGERAAYGFETGEETEQGVTITMVNSTLPLLSMDKTLVRKCNTLKPLCVKRDCGRSNSVMNVQAVKDEWTGQDLVVDIWDRKYFRCYGVLISRNTVLATEYCARVGSHGKLGDRKLEWPDSTIESPIALLHLTDDVSDVHPVCLPDPSIEVVNKCYLIGTDFDTQNEKTFLKPVKVKMYNRTECSDQFPGLNVKDSMICVSLGQERFRSYPPGTFANHIRLLCKDRYGFWTLMGLFASELQDFVVEKTLYKVVPYHSISDDVQRITNEIDCSFRCDDNNCIYPSKVCDGIYNCADKSDESRYCNVTCDFEDDPFICGFRFTRDASGWIITPSDEMIRDHTTGSPQGHYLLYENTSQTFSNGSVLLSPTFSATSDACLEFYHLMPSSEVGFAVHLEDLDSGTSVEVYSRSNRQGNRWRLAQISLLPGRYRAHFHPTANHSSIAIGLDDFRLKEGSCPEGVISCAVDEHKCTERQCINLEDSCNVEHNSCANSSSLSSCFKKSIISVPVKKDPIRLVDGVFSYEGRVEIYHNGVWGTICDDAWNRRSAAVVCRMLGYSGGEDLSLRFGFGAGLGTIWLDNVSCFGSEPHIADCSHDAWGINDCVHREDVSVRCDAKESPLDVRLVGERAEQGRVEVFYNGRWGTICDSHWDDKDANVVCKSLGYRIGVTYRVPYAYAGRYDKMVLMEEVHCAGTERSLFQCPWIALLNDTDCSYPDAAGVTCIGAGFFPPVESETWISPTPLSVTRNNSVPVNESVRLQGGATPKEGRAEVFVNDTWGTICNDLWTELESSILCRTMGYDSGTTVSIENHSHGENEPIWLDDVHCTANSTDIFDCSSAPFGYHDCTHYQDVAVRCE